MGVLLSEKNYKQIKEKAQQAHKDLNIEQLDCDKKEEVVTQYLKGMKFTNSDEYDIYFGTCLIADDVLFYNLYLESGKVTKTIAKKFNVTEKAVLCKIFEFSKYNIYLDLNTKRNLSSSPKKENSIKEVEIIKEPNTRNDEVGTQHIIKKISSLMKENEEKTNKIEYLTKENENYNKEINNLKYINKEQNDKISHLDSKLNQQEIINKENEEIIKKLKQDIKFLLKYKETYEEIDNLFQNNEKNIKK